MIISDIRTHYYLCLAEPMPEPITNKDGSLNVEADNASLQRWSEGNDKILYTEDEVVTFVDGVLDLLSDLESTDTDSTEEEIQKVFYDHAKLTFGEEKAEIRKFFAMLYLLLFHRNHGPRWGQLVKIIGLDAFDQMVRERLNNPLNIPDKESDMT